MNQALTMHMYWISVRLHGKWLHNVTLWLAQGQYCWTFAHCCCNSTLCYSEAMSVSEIPFGEQLALTYLVLCGVELDMENMVRFMSDRDLTLGWLWRKIIHKFWNIVKCLSMLRMVCCLILWLEQHLSQCLCSTRWWLAHSAILWTQDTADLGTQECWSWESPRDSQTDACNLMINQWFSVRWCCVVVVNHHLIWCQMLCAVTCVDCQSTWLVTS